jgi:hypothetical protein
MLTSKQERKKKLYIFRQQENFAAFLRPLYTAGKAIPVQNLKVLEV